MTAQGGGVINSNQNQMGQIKTLNEGVLRGYQMKLELTAETMK